jgi:nitroreductase
MKKIIEFIKPYGRIVQAIHGFLYDFLRFYLYSAWRANMQDSIVRNYNAVKIYHALEKSMSFQQRKRGSGWSAAQLLLLLLKKAKLSNKWGFHDKKAISILSDFIKVENENPQAKIVEEELRKLELESTHSNESTREHSLENFRQGILENPEKFFWSRHSLREFRCECVPENLIHKAISLASKTPSVCNRQPWHVYYTSEKEVIQDALKYQNGNRGFGDKVPHLLIITSDLRAFMSSAERYQHWIDGGMFAMSMVYAFHSLGIASCCLNWSQFPGTDNAFHKNFEIEPHHAIIMMVAFGWPNQANKVCESARRPIDSFYTILKKKGR